MKVKDAEELERLIQKIQYEIDLEWFTWLESYLGRLDEIKE